MPSSTCCETTVVASTCNEVVATPVKVKVTKLHPLDSLTLNEIGASVRLIRATYPNKKWIFNAVSLEEPLKPAVLEYIAAEENGDLPLPSIPRRSKAVLIEHYTGKVTEVIVNLTSKVIESYVDIPFGNQPTFTMEETIIAEEIVKNDIGVQKRLAKLGIENLDLMVSDPWVVSYEGLDPKFRGRRLMQSFMYMRMYEYDNHYAHPLDFAPIVDLALEEVVLIEDVPVHPDIKTPRGSKVTYPKACSNFVHELHPEGFLRKDIKPLQVIQPKGPSFTLSGNELSWQKFKIRIGFNYREGLVLHNVSYQDGDRRRPLIYRASLGEMIVPYGDPRPVYHRKCAFDVGEYGLGFCTNSLQLGCDCLGAIKYLDAFIVNHKGEPTTIKNAICIHEEDDGILYKHFEYRNDHVTLARSRKLIISFIVTVANYEYAFYWTFRQDASIHFEIKATGIISTILRMNSENASFASPVMDNVSGQFHQHVYCMRLDTMFDGVKNTLYTVDTTPLKGNMGSEDNPYGQGFSSTLTPIKSTKHGFSDNLTEKSRFWIIGNDEKRHPTTGGPTSWKLYPGNPVRLMAKPGSHIYEHAGFARHAVWVTPYDANQLYPAGKYINTINGFNGLAEWVKEEKNIENEDIVLWHVFGTTHIVRTEDFPIMPVETCGFALKPFNFFMCNPALDVPPPHRNENKSVYAHAYVENGN